MPIVMMTRKVVKGAMNMPLQNQLKEHRSRMGINQTRAWKACRGIETDHQSDRGEEIIHRQWHWH